MRGGNQSQVNVPELETVKNTFEIDIIEEERVKSKKVTKVSKKSPVKREKVRKQVAAKPKPVKGPSRRVQKQSEEKKMTRVEWIEKMEHQKVLNGKVFDYGILTKPGMENLFDAVSIQGWNHIFDPPAPYLCEPEVREFYCKMKLLEGGGITTTVKDVEIRLDEETLGIILGVPTEGIRTIEGCKPSNSFTKSSTKCEDVKTAGLPKKFLKGSYQLLFEFINKVLVPRSEKRTMLLDINLVVAFERIEKFKEFVLPKAFIATTALCFNFEQAIPKSCT
ncbi:hypothetical protein H5410_031808 [Solanum commersonii]|uniref:Uncharacterized protein n=1 Tax=Solanum commersonii TaxID=4109 RepID=A0A9J5YNG8_SOLCO|nr:hypothetical protein H5410_031808 [Solanum commersonii]